MSNSTGGGVAAILGDLPGVDNGSCQLLGPTALTVQAVMGVLVLLSLLYKRHREPQPRPWRIWLFDVSKQVLGQAFVHGINVLISDFTASQSFSNACVSYFLNILLDTTLGVALLFVILRVLAYILVGRFHLQGFESGVYGSPPSFTYWVRQTAVYVSSLSAMKFIVIGLIALFPGLEEIGSWLLSWTYTQQGDAVQVIFVMGVFPIIMNILQFWIIDSMVKSKDSPSSTSRDLEETLAPADDEAREPLFSAGLRDSEDSEDSTRRPSSRSSILTDSKLAKTKGVDDDDEDAEVVSRTFHYPPVRSESAIASGPSPTATPRLRTPSITTKPLRPASLIIDARRTPAINSPDPRTAEDKDKDKAGWDAWGHDDDDAVSDNENWDMELTKSRSDFKDS